MSLHPEIPEHSGVVPPGEVITCCGFLVCVEKCGPFGNMYLRESTDWNSASAMTEFRDNATHYPTVEAANRAYRTWMARSKNVLAHYHRLLNAVPEPA